MIKTFSQRLCPPYSGQAQIAESERARAITMDGSLWEIHFMHAIQNAETYGLKDFQRSFRRVAYIRHSELARISAEREHDGRPIDARILELTAFLKDVSLPFPAADIYEYWLLDAADESPLAMIFSCVADEQTSTYPDRPEWTALPASMMPIESTEDEKAENALPVNYRVECLVNERAGYKPRARWFRRHADEAENFPPLLLREDWPGAADHDLCQRYIQRKSARLLMLHGLSHDDRLRLEQAARPHALEVARFYTMYPEIADTDLMNAIRVEARMRDSKEDQASSIHNRRDGVLYI